MKTLLLTLILIAFSACSSYKGEEFLQRKEHYAKPILFLDLKNLHKVDDRLYRSSQPSAEDFQKLYQYGIKYDLNLRQLHDDEDELKNIPIKKYHIPINTSKMSYEQLVEAVAYLASRDGKTLVHCLHGSDRTGTVVAGYRIAVNDWSKEKAIDELKNGGFGYHKFWFSNLPKLLNSLDTKEFKKDVQKKMAEF